MDVEEKSYKEQRGSYAPDSPADDQQSFAAYESAGGTRWQRFVDGFRRDPHQTATPNGAIGADGHVFDPEAAAAGTADSPLARKLKGRHLQMIAIGGSIGTCSHLVKMDCC